MYNIYKIQVFSMVFHNFKHYISLYMCVFSVAQSCQLFATLWTVAQ